MGSFYALVGLFDFLLLTFLYFVRLSRFISKAINLLYFYPSGNYFFPYQLAYRTLAPKGLTARLFDETGREIDLGLSPARFDGLGRTFLFLRNPKSPKQSDAPVSGVRQEERQGPKEGSLVKPHRLGEIGLKAKKPHHEEEKKKGRAKLPHETSKHLLHLRFVYRAKPVVFILYWKD